MLCRFQTYFPHVDNVYSHRSTQRYKRKTFVSHYWDCRLKGRPPGTKKSDDPNKRKRKRNARERDLCDVKIKITEHFVDEAPEYRGPPTDGTSAPIDPEASFSVTNNAPNHINGEGMSNGVQAPQPKRHYVIQRVNGNGANGKTDGVPGPHKHTLAESDRIKKNSIERSMLNKEKVRRKTEVSLVLFAYCSSSVPRVFKAARGATSSSGAEVLVLATSSVCVHLESFVSLTSTIYTL